MKWALEYNSLSNKQICVLYILLTSLEINLTLGLHMRMEQNIKMNPGYYIVSPGYVTDVYKDKVSFFITSKEFLYPINTYEEVIKHLENEYHAKSIL